MKYIYIYITIYKYIYIYMYVCNNLVYNSISLSIYMYTYTYIFATLADRGLDPGTRPGVRRHVVIVPCHFLQYYIHIYMPCLSLSLSFSLSTQQVIPTADFRNSPGGRTTQKNLGRQQTAWRQESGGGDELLDGARGARPFSSILQA